MARDDPQAFCWGLLGAGGVSRKFLLGLRALGNRTSVGIVASRTIENAKRFGADFKIERVTADYAEAAAAPEVQALYIATPPAEHEAHALLGIAAGKHVLIEKPFALDAAAARRIAAAAEAAGVFCMEAMWTRFLPLVGTIKARIEAGDLGEIRAFHGSFFGASDPIKMPNSFNPALGGGALMHRGIYPLSLARYFLGPVTDVQAMACLGPSGVDEDCTLMLRHASGAISTLRASLRVNGDSVVSIHGTDGMINVAAPIWRPFRAAYHATVPGGPDRSGGPLEAFKEGSLVRGLAQRLGPAVKAVRGGGAALKGYYAGNGYQYEAAALMDAVSRGETLSAVMPMTESIEIMDIVDEARRQWIASS